MVTAWVDEEDDALWGQGIIMGTRHHQRFVLSTLKKRSFQHLFEKDWSYLQLVTKIRTVGKDPYSLSPRHDLPPLHLVCVRLQSPQALALCLS